MSKCIARLKQVPAVQRLKKITGASHTFLSCFAVGSLANECILLKQSLHYWFLYYRCLFGLYNRLVARSCLCPPLGKTSVSLFSSLFNLFKRIPILECRTTGARDTYWALNFFYLIQRCTTLVEAFAIVNSRKIQILVFHSCSSLQFLGPWCLMC